MVALLTFPSAIVLPVLLAAHGFRKGSLSISGALAALVVGFVSFATPVKSFGITLLVFYFTGSRATKVGHQRKAKLETESYRSTTTKEKQEHKSAAGGKRDAWQVLCNSALSACTAFLFFVLYADERPWAQGHAWCLFDDAPRTAAANSLNRLQRFLGVQIAHLVSPQLPRTLFLIMLGHFACCMGDTLASELGILAKRPPRLILPPFRTVPPGTNGALSVQGTLGSLLGGAFIGLTASSVCVLFDNKACMPHLASIVVKTTLLGALGGLGGSGIDSLLGATLQRTWYNPERKLVLLGRLPKSLLTNKKKASKNDQWHVVTGYDVLSNNSVNFFASALTAFLVAYVGNAAMF